MSGKNFSRHPRFAGAGLPGLHRTQFEIFAPSLIASPRIPWRAGASALWWRGDGGAFIGGGEAHRSVGSAIEIHSEPNRPQYTVENFPSAKAP
jgi:hypothetical protein